MIVISVHNLIDSGLLLFFRGHCYCCTGNLTAWTKCTYWTRSPDRKAWHIPDDLQEDHPYLYATLYSGSVVIYVVELMRTIFDNFATRLVVKVRHSRLCSSFRYLVGIMYWVWDFYVFWYKDSDCPHLECNDISVPVSHMFSKGQCILYHSVKSSNFL